MQPFTAGRHGRLHRGRREGGVHVGLAEPERTVLVGLLLQLDELLDDGTPTASDRLEELDPLERLTGMIGSPSAHPPRPPEDPALARLLPDGNREDAELAGEYRRLTEFDLRARKRSAARSSADALRRPEPVTLATGEAVDLLKAMTDLRLVLGERLELRTDEDADVLHERLHGLRGPQPEDWIGAAAVYEVLTLWQESLVAAVSRAGA